MARGRGSQVASWKIETTGFNDLRRAMKTLGITDAPFLRAALQDTAEDLREELRSRGGSVARRVIIKPIRGQGAAIRQVVTVDHPAAKVREFGRTKWWHSLFSDRVVGIGNNQRGSRRRKRAFKTKAGAYHNRSVPARPYAGIKGGGHAIGAIQPRMRTNLEQAIAREWTRIHANLGGD